MTIDDNIFNVANIATYITGVLTTLVGVIIGYLLNVFSNKRKLKKYEEHFFCELVEIRSAYSSWLKVLFHEFAKPQVVTINYPPKVDFDFIKSLQLFLSENVNIEQRKLFHWLTLSNELLNNNFKHRDDFSKNSTHKTIIHLDRFYTSIMIIELSLSLNVLDKSINEKSYVKIPDSLNRLEVLKYACEVSKIEFLEDLCINILEYSKDKSVVKNVFT